MGTPLRRAAAITPGCTVSRGPRGPSGVMAASLPCFKAFKISRKPMAPFRVELPRAVVNPNLSMVRLMYSPSRCSLMRMVTVFLGYE